MNISEKPANFGSNNRLRAFALAWCNTFPLSTNFAREPSFMKEILPEFGRLMFCYVYGSIALSPPLSSCSLDRSRIILLEKPEQLVSSSGAYNYVSLCSVTSNCSHTMLQALSSHLSPNPGQKNSKSNEMLYRQRHCAYWTWLPPDQRKLKGRS